MPNVSILNITYTQSLPDLQQSRSGWTTETKQGKARQGSIDQACILPCKALSMALAHAGFWHVTRLPLCKANQTILPASEMPSLQFLTLSFSTAGAAFLMASTLSPLPAELLED